MSRCTGRCCRSFSLDIGSLTDPDPTKTIIDGDMIRAMVILLEHDGDGDRYTCTCRYFDGRDCLAYESRPAMCRDFPYGRPCPWLDRGCTLETTPCPTPATPS